MIDSVVTKELFITRIINASVLIEMGEDVILTDPYFRKRWYLGVDEPVGLAPEELPKLSAIIGGHSFLDHWQMKTLEPYPYKAETPVFVATSSMERQARAAGFLSVERLNWGEMRHISNSLSLHVVQAQYSGGLKVNNYVLETAGLRVFFGSETCRLEPLRRYREGGTSVDVVLAPVNGVRLLGLLKLVTNGPEAVEAARILGARTLIPIHDAHRPIPVLLGVSSSSADAQEAAKNAGDGICVVQLKTGERWKLPIHDTRA